MSGGRDDRWAPAAPDGKEPHTLTREEAADYCRISVSTLDRERAAGAVKFHKLGDGPRGPVRFRRQDLDAYLERRAVAPRSHSGTDRQELLRLAEKAEEICRTLRARLVGARGGS